MSSLGLDKVSLEMEKKQHSRNERMPGMRIATIIYVDVYDDVF